MRDPRFDVLFEPVRIGPVTAPNRFYQVPHCTGMGWQRPKALAAMRGIKAEGGWGVVCTEYCSVHPSSDDLGYPFAALWSDDDIRAHALMTDAVHAHGALAGVELWLGGAYSANLSTRLPPLSVRTQPPTEGRVPHPVQSRRLDRADIRALRRWHRAAADRALLAGFDIVYVYATHGYLLSEFLDPEINDRTDEYGGPLVNRIRLVRELIEETLEATRGRAAVAVRFSVSADVPESYEAFGMLADLPDLWDLTVHSYDIEMGTSRFIGEAALSDAVARARALTSRPVVAVGRFTSPDTMAQVIRSGVQDLIGAARPSIADPFLPKKIAEGREDDIRECIGCNICYAHNTLGVPIRCTQNPTMGEEWRLGWHPERVAPASGPDRVLVVGAGPAGLEAARVLGARGHDVLLAEAGRTLGGRAVREAALPGLSAWRRVADWRISQLAKLSTVAIYRESMLSTQDIRELDVTHVLLATGAHWSLDGIGRHTPSGIAASPGLVSADRVIGALTRDDAALPDGHRVLIYDDDHYLLGSVLALALSAAGRAVQLVTPLGRVASWCEHTEEQHQTAAALISAGVELVTNHRLVGVQEAGAHLACVFTARPRELEADWVVPLTRRLPNDDLFVELTRDRDALDAAGIRSVRRIGDCEAPSLIAGAVYSGYRAAMELGDATGDADALQVRREQPPA